MALTVEVGDSEVVDSGLGLAWYADAEDGAGW